MFDAVPQATKSKLWDHQTDALGFAIKHLNQEDSPCLIRMPTGTGKTGVIACLTRQSNQGSSLYAHFFEFFLCQAEADRPGAAPDYYRH